MHKFIQLNLAHHCPHSFIITKRCHH